MKNLDSKAMLFHTLFFILQFIQIQLSSKFHSLDQLPESIRVLPYSTSKKRECRVILFDVLQQPVHDRVQVDGADTFGPPFHNWKSHKLDSGDTVYRTAEHAQHCWMSQPQERLILTLAWNDETCGFLALELKKVSFVVNKKFNFWYQKLWSD